MTSKAAERVSSTKISHKLVHGQRILVKSATGRERSRLRHEAEVLGLLHLSAVVDMLELKEEDDQTLLLLLDNGPRTLLWPLDMTGEELLRALQRCCTAVEQLHEAGWSHGSLRPEHVLLGARGRPKLCSLGDSQPLLHLSNEKAASAIQGDVDQLAAMFAHVANFQIASMSRSDRWRWRQQSRTLRQIAELNETSTAALTTTELATAVGELRSRSISPLRRRSRATTRRATPAPGPARGLVTLGAAAAGIALLFSAGFALTASSKTPSQTDSAQAAPWLPDASTSATTVPATLVPATTVPDTSLADASLPATKLPDSSGGGCGLWPMLNNGSGLGVDIDGDSCPDHVEIAGQFITVDDLTYQVGLPQDRLAVGDWNCDGRATALLLRPSTGELFEFSAWAKPGETAQSELVSTIAEAADLSGERITDSTAAEKISCDRALVALIDGSQVDPFSQPAKAKP